MDKNPKTFIFVVILSLSLALSSQGLQYPETRKSDLLDTYQGVRVADPYRWLEDTDSTETGRWVEAQNKLTFGYLEKLPLRERLRQRLTRIWNYPRYEPPFQQGGQYFYFKNDGLQNQSVLYVQKSLQGQPRVLIDPNTLSSDGTVALAVTSVSEDGKLLGYGLSQAGSDWQEFRVRDVASGKDLVDEVKWVKFSGLAWTRESRGFFYSRYLETEDKLRQANRNQKLYYHVVGQPQSQDRLIYERPDQPEWRFGADTTEDGRYAIIWITKSGPRNRVYYVDLLDSRKPDVAAPIVKLIDAFEALYGFVGNDGPVFYFFTDLDAPRRRVIAIDTRKPERHNWRTVIAESPDKLEDVTLIGNQFIATYLHNAYSQARWFDLQGKFVKDLRLPAIGTVSIPNTNRSDRELFYTFTSFIHPHEIYRYDLRSGESSLFRKSEADFDPSKYETQQVWYNSKDGTRVPMFITQRKGLRRDGSNAMYLTGYGGFNVSMKPAFSIASVVWLESGGAVALPNLRGGGEFGEEWHRAGTRERKQNVFDDFIAAAEYLVREGYTSANRLAIAGGSNGGLLVGAVLNQRPDLFAVALPAVGVMDMLRFHKFTIGSAWVDDYGSSDDPAHFKALYAYSPLHNIRAGTSYPATLITTADHDDRVVPGHSFKYAATLQAAQAGPAPILIRIETRAGHGAGKPTSKRIEEAADRWAFVMHHLRMGLRP